MAKPVREGVKGCERPIPLAQAGVENDLREWLAQELLVDGMPPQLDHDALGRGRSEEVLEREHAAAEVRNPRLHERDELVDHGERWIDSVRARADRPATRDSALTLTRSAPA